MSFFYHKKSSRIAMVILGLLSILMSAYFVYTNKSSIIDTFIIVIGAFAIAEAFLKKIFIDSKGVSYSFLNKKYVLKWKDVKHVDVFDLSSRKRRNNVICFSTKPVDASSINPKNISDELILTLNAEKEIFDEVKKYWNGTIGGLEYLE